MELKKTPLHDIHEALGARFTAFAGWAMPLRYSGELEEHRSVRAGCGIFDVSHMGEVEVSGPGSLEAVEHITTNDLSRLSDGQCQYTLITNPGGGIIDDCIVYRLSPGPGRSSEPGPSGERFLFCLNAGNTDRAAAWIRDKCPAGVGVEDLSGSFAQIALQGPASGKVLARAASAGLVSGPSAIKFHHFSSASVGGVEALVSRTGYTGEHGYEFYVEPSRAASLWHVLMEAGRDEGITPCGLAARDVLRLEMGYPLYGHELGEDTSPVEAALGGFVALDKDFIGKRAIEEQLKSGPAKVLVGLRLLGKAIARSGSAIIASGRTVGRVTSGSFSPSLGAPIALGYVEPPLAAPGTELDITVRKREVKAVVTELPFYHRPGAAAAG